MIAIQDRFLLMEEILEIMKLENSGEASESSARSPYYFMELFRRILNIIRKVWNSMILKKLLDKLML
jgi:hypothetical protein